MARIDSYENFLTDMADCVRSVTGTEDTIYPADMDTAITAKTTELNNEIEDTKGQLIRSATLGSAACFIQPYDQECCISLQFESLMIAAYPDEMVMFKWYGYDENNCDLKFWFNHECTTISLIRTPGGSVGIDGDKLKSFIENIGILENPDADMSSLMVQIPYRCLRIREYEHELVLTNRDQIDMDIKDTKELIKWYNGEANKFIYLVPRWGLIMLEDTEE